jgi:DNA-binding PadR family transcriptional regulator
MFRFSHERGRHGAPRGSRPEMDVERFFHWIERLNDSEHRRNGGGRSRRMFDGGELRLVLLKLIADAPRHGYELIKAIEELTGGAYAPSPGIVYPALSMLDEMDLVAEQPSEGAKKRFAITESGRAHLAEKADEVAALMARLESIGEHRASSDRAPIRRAMRNLRTVLQNRLEAGNLSDDHAHEIAELIDTIVHKIERMK